MIERIDIILLIVVIALALRWATNQRAPRHDGEQ